MDDVRYKSNLEDLDEDTDNWTGLEFDTPGNLRIESRDTQSASDVRMEPHKGKERERVLKPLTREALAVFEEAQRRAGIIYISRIPPQMRPQKLRHIMSAYGEVGRIYMTLEDEKYAKARRKETNSKNRHFTEGWVEFADKRVARSVADLLNARAVGGKRGSRYRDDIWTMKYLPKFKWNMLTEQLHHDKAARTARLRIEIVQSRQEQEDYLKQVSLGKKLEKRSKKKKKTNDGDDPNAWSNVYQGPQKQPRVEEASPETAAKEGELQTVLGKIF